MLEHIGKKAEPDLHHSKRGLGAVMLTRESNRRVDNRRHGTRLSVIPRTAGSDGTHTHRDTAPPPVDTASTVLSGFVSTGVSGSVQRRHQVSAILAVVVASVVAVSCQTDPAVDRPYFAVAVVVWAAGLGFRPFVPGDFPRFQHPRRLGCHSWAPALSASFVRFFAGRVRRLDAEMSQ